MTFRLIRTLAGASLLVLCLFTNAQSPHPRQQQFITLKRVIELNHYHPRPVNDSFSIDLFDGILLRLGKDYFLRTDLHALSSFRTTLDDELSGQPGLFFPTLLPAFRAAMASADSLPGTKPDKKSRRRLIKNLLEHPAELENYAAAAYCEVMANLFDPHTEYMPPSEKEDFNAGLSSEGMYFGFSLAKNNSGDMEIVRLLPGSPAWKCGDLNKGDVLIKLGTEGKEPMDVTMAGAEAISEMLDTIGITPLYLTVRKANGIHKTLSLVKQKIRNEDNVIKGFVLHGERRIGYVYLPGFYSAYGAIQGSCANDMASEIIKLKKDSIEGLIIDLRYNGGGSMQEALDMAGIFIDEGPLSLIRERDNRVVALKDPNRGTIYDGPLTVLINGQSASASELLSGVLQDYHRAVVAGCRSYGKGSAQVILPVDTSGTLALGAVPPYGFVKVTTSKFYRVTGNTTQYAGVVPDVLLPDLFDGLDYHESSMPHALTPDTVKKNNYYKPLPALPLQRLSANSSARIGAQKQFQLISARSKTVNDFREDSDQDMALSVSNSRLYQPLNSSFDTSRVRQDSYLSEINERWMEKIRKDVYIEEAYNIVNDLITFK